MPDKRKSEVYKYIWGGGVGGLCSCKNKWIKSFEQNHCAYEDMWHDSDFANVKVLHLVIEKLIWSCLQSLRQYSLYYWPVAGLHWLLRKISGSLADKFYFYQSAAKLNKMVKSGKQCSKKTLKLRRAKEGCRGSIFQITYCIVKVSMY